MICTNSDLILAIALKFWGKLALKVEDISIDLLVGFEMNLGEVDDCDSS